MHMSHHTRLCAFTLIELLVVISIIAVLISLLLPSLGQSRELARNLYCSAGARAAQLGIELYSNDEKDYIVSNNPDSYTGTPSGLPASIGFPAGSFSNTRNWAGVLYDRGYTQLMAFTNKGGCPYGPRPALLDLTSWGNDYYSDTTLASIAYGMNPSLQGYGFFNPYVTPYYSNLGKQRRTKGRTAEQPPSLLVYVTCCVTPWWNGAAHPGVALYHTLGVPNHYTSTLLSPTSSGFRERRHEGKGLPMVMGDGHGQFIKTEEITLQGATASYWLNEPMTSFSWRNNYKGTWYLGPSIVN